MIFRCIEVSPGHDQVGKDFDDDNFMLRIQDLPTLTLVDVNKVYRIPWRLSVVDVTSNPPVVRW